MEHTIERNGSTYQLYKVMGKLIVGDKKYWVLANHGYHGNGAVLDLSVVRVGAGRADTDTEAYLLFDKPFDLRVSGSWVFEEESTISHLYAKTESGTF